MLSAPDPVERQENRRRTGERGLKPPPSRPPFRRRHKTSDRIGISSPVRSLDRLLTGIT